MNGRITTLITLIFIMATTAGCTLNNSDLENGAEGVCIIDGESYEVGEGFPAGDGCNSCTCRENGDAICTIVGCLEEPLPEEVQCEADGEFYEVGESFPSGDGCNSCGCNEDGTIICTLLLCANTCQIDTNVYFPGEEFDAGDGCNTCTCTDSGEVVCTMMACLETCEYEGDTFFMGDTFDASDGCNTCECTLGGSVACTEMPCTIEPFDENLNHKDGCGDTNIIAYNQDYTTSINLYYDGLVAEAIAAGGTLYKDISLPSSNLTVELLKGTALDNNACWGDPATAEILETYLPVLGGIIIDVTVTGVGGPQGTPALADITYSDVLFERGTDSIFVDTLEIKNVTVGLTP